MHINHYNCTLILLERKNLNNKNIEVILMEKRCEDEMTKTSNSVIFSLFYRGVSFDETKEMVI